MKIVGRFGIVNGALDSIQYENETRSEFRRLFVLWSDPAYLNKFFTAREQQLKNYCGLTVTQAIRQTRQEAKALEQKMYRMAEAGLRNESDNLSMVFTELEENILKDVDFREYKAYGDGDPSLIRIYAIRLNINYYVVSGGGIKTVSRIKDCEVLRKELPKLELTRQYLQTEENSIEALNLKP